MDPYRRLSPTRTIIISWLDVAGSIDENTPLVVLADIVKFSPVASATTNIKRKGIATRTASKLAERIENGPLNRADIIAKITPTTFHNPFQTDEIVQAARFVNPEVEWDENALHIAINFIDRFRQNPHPPVGEFWNGRATPTAPNSYTSVMLYRILRERSIPTYPSTTTAQMETAISILVHTETPSLGRAIVSSEILGVSTETEMATIYLYGSNMKSKNCRLASAVDAASDSVVSSQPKRVRWVSEPPSSLSSSSSSSASSTSMTPTPTPPHLISHTLLTDTASILNNHSLTLKKMVPSSPEEAVSLAALLYQVDLTATRSPIQEYEILIANPDNYQNPDSDRIDMTFNPIIPAALYTVENLRELALREGFERSELRSEGPYSLLHLASVSNTFYHGTTRNVTIKNTESPVEYADIKDIPLNSIALYGTKLGAIAYRYRELATIFRGYKCFRDIHGGDRVSYEPRLIRKLKLLCKKIYPGDTDDTIAERNTLYDAIAFVEIIIDDCTNKLKGMLDVYLASDDATKATIRATITHLFDLGMYMRGWIGSGVYPTSVAPVDSQSEVDIRVTMAISRFDEDIERLEDIGRLILDLPLQKHIGGGRYILSSTEGDGLTIGSRLGMARAGTDFARVVSCIRLTSNWICPTAYRIMQLLEMELPINIEVFRDVS